jgi:quercetin dioxygenase-like cupin family protein
MSGKFIPAAQADREKLDWGTLAWLSRPTTTEAEQLVVIEVNLSPGHGHNFHKHPEQEEVIYVIEGSIEQWLRQEKRMLNPGDSVFIPADTVHASFNVSSRPAKLLAILGPCVGPGGYQLVDVSGDAPWNALR